MKYKIAALLVVIFCMGALAPTPAEGASIVVQIGDRPYYRYGSSYWHHGARWYWVSGHWAWRHGNRYWIHGHYAPRYYGNYGPYHRYY